MVRETRYYDLLDVAPDASESGIKKAYRKKLLVLHPDKSGDIKEVTHAYDVLTDSEKRSIYDARGEAGLPEQGGTCSINPQDRFSKPFGGGGGRSQGVRKTKDLVHRVQVSLEDLYMGKINKFCLTRNVLCSKCNGKGGKGGAVRTCATCNGRGVKVVLRQVGPMVQQAQPICDGCSGTGESIGVKDQCRTCKGKKVMPEKKIIKVRIDKGMKGGQTITLAGESDQSPDAQPGDVIIAIEEKPHERFRRQENDLVTEIEVDLLTALAGGVVAIKHLDNRALLIRFMPGEVVKNEAVKVIRSRGMPSQWRHEPGDLFVKFTVKFPDSIDPNKVLLAELFLPPRTPLQKFPKNILIENVNLEEPDARSRAKATANDVVDEDDGGEPRVQCANQ